MRIYNLLKRFHLPETNQIKWVIKTRTIPKEAQQSLFRGNTLPVNSSRRVSRLDAAKINEQRSLVWLKLKLGVLKFRKAVLELEVHKANRTDAGTGHVHYDKTTWLECRDIRPRILKLFGFSLIITNRLAIYNQSFILEFLSIWFEWCSDAHLDASTKLLDIWTAIKN